MLGWGFSHVGEMIGGCLRNIQSEDIKKREELVVRSTNSLLRGRVHPSLPLYRGVI